MSTSEHDGHHPTSVTRFENHGDQRLGFLGVGTMNAAIVRGLLFRPPRGGRSDPSTRPPRGGRPHPLPSSTREDEEPGREDESLSPRLLVLSPRGREQVQNLVAEFPDSVEVAASNQAVLDNSDLVFVGLRAETIKDAFKELRWSKQHQIVNLTTMPNEDMAALAVLRGGHGGSTGNGDMPGLGDEEDSPRGAPVLGDEEDHSRSSTSSPRTRCLKRQKRRFFDESASRDEFHGSTTLRIPPDQASDCRSAASSSSTTCLEVSQIIHVVPLPAVATRSGVCYMTPRGCAPFETVHALFSRLCPASSGGCVAVVDSQKTADVYHTFLCLMGPLYQQLEAAQRWGLERLERLQGERLEGEQKQHTTTREEHERQTRKFLVSVMNAALADCVGEKSTFAHGINTQTPGGLNELVMRARKDFDQKNLPKVLDRVWGKLAGEEQAGG